MNMVGPAITEAAPLEPLPRRDRLPGWLRLAETSTEPNPFYHPALLIPALDHLDEGQKVRLIEARDENGEPIGLIPVLPKLRHARYIVRNAANWMHDQCFYGAPLLRKGVEQAAWAQLLTRLDQARWAGNFLHVNGLDLTSPVAIALMRHCAETQRGLKLIATHERAMLQSSLDGESYWETHVRPKKRKEIRRLLNRLGEIGTVTRTRFGVGDDLEGWTRDFLALERSGWKGAEGTALDSNRDSRAFFTAALAGARDADMLDMLRIDLDGIAIAMLVNFRMGRGSFSYKIAFDEHFARFSPGVLIEIDNLCATLSDPALDWMDSCAAPNHPMIDGIWAERRTIGQFRVALKGHGLHGLKRRAVFTTTGLAEHAIDSLRRKNR